MGDRRQVAEELDNSNNLKVSTAFVAMLWRLQPRRVMSAVGLTVMSGLVGGAGILLLLPLLELVGPGTDSPKHGISAYLTSVLTTVGLTPGLDVILFLFLFLVCCQVVMQRYLTLNNARLRLEFGRSLQNRMFRSITCVRWGFYIQQRLSDFIHVLSRDVTRVSHGALILLSLLSSAVLVAIHVSLSLVVSFWLSLVVVSSALALTPFLLRLNRRASRSGLDYTLQSGRFFHQIEQQLTGMKEIKTLNAEARQLAGFHDLTQAMYDAELRFTKVNSTATVMFTLGASGVLSGLLYVAIRVFQIPAAELFVVVVIFSKLAPQFRRLHGQYQSLLHTLASFESAMKMQRKLDAEAEHNLSDDSATGLKVVSGDRLTNACSVEFKDVAFRYSPVDDAWALRNICLSIPENQTTAIVGPSGSGKSTLADLMLGLLTPTSGQVFVNSRPLAGGNLSDWRSRIGYVPQETFLLHTSIRANLLLARPNALDGEIQSALEAASASDFVSRMPDGLDTIIGDRGVRISGGERQRIALARALLRQPEILILDEATSSLDIENQDRILSAIGQIHEKMTVVVIAHRLSTVRDADQIVVLEGGRIVESGSYDELTARAGGTFQSYLKADSASRFG